MYKKGAGNDKQGKDAGNRTLCPYRNFSQAIKSCYRPTSLSIPGNNCFDVQGVYSKCSEAKKNTENYPEKESLSVFSIINQSRLVYLWGNLRVMSTSPSCYLSLKEIPIRQL